MYLKHFLTFLLLLFFLNLFVTDSKTSEKKTETERSGYWTYYCENHEEIRQCDIARKINIEQQNETFLIAYKITKDRNGKVKESFNIVTPPAPRVDINKRLKISFDNKTKFTRSFIECESDGCLVIFKGSRMLKYSMKNSNKMKIIFYISGDKVPTSLTLSIDGFVQALNNISQKLKAY